MRVRSASTLFQQRALNPKPSVVGMAKLDVDDDASCVITHAYHSCLLAFWDSHAHSATAWTLQSFELQRCHLLKYIYLPDWITEPVSESRVLQVFC